MLAYITPEEGGILQLLGGSGAPGPMGIPSFYADDAADSGTGPGSSSSNDSDSPSNSQSMGIDSSYSDMSSISQGPSQSESDTNDSIAAAIAASRAQDPNYGRVTETIDPAAQTASMLGITPTNPFGYKSPFSGFTDALGLYVHNRFSSKI
jgi:hypothetical protein